MLTNDYLKITKITSVICKIVCIYNVAQTEYVHNYNLFISLFIKWKKHGSYWVNPTPSKITVVKQQPVLAFTNTHFDPYRPKSFDRFYKGLYIVSVFSKILNLWVSIRRVRWISIFLDQFVLIFSCLLGLLSPKMFTFFGLKFRIKHSKPKFWVRIWDIQHGWVRILLSVGVIMAVTCDLGIRNKMNIFLCQLTEHMRCGTLPLPLD